MTTKNALVRQVVDRKALAEAGVPDRAVKQLEDVVRDFENAERTCDLDSMVEHLIGMGELFGGMVRRLVTPRKADFTGLLLINNMDREMRSAALSSLLECGCGKGAA